MLSGISRTKEKLLDIIEPNSPPSYDGGGGEYCPHVRNVYTSFVYRYSC